MTQNSIQPFRSGYAAIIGAPNAGKSTLMNSLLRQKMAIVSPKPQTTRYKVMGIMNTDSYQVILLDTPGLLEPRYLLQQKMMELSRKAIQDADVILAIVDMHRNAREENLLGSVLKTASKPRLLVMNKTDLLKKPLSENEILEKTSALECNEGIAISAKTGDGLDRLTGLLLKYIPEGSPFYPPDQLTDESERFFVMEMIREQLYFHYGQEVPYASHVQIAEFIENENRKDLITAVITVERDSQKAILIGKGGESLKKVGMAAREEIEKLLGRNVFLKLEVRVRKNWRKDPVILRQIGFS